jgi:hypothetical protein
MSAIILTCLLFGLSLRWGHLDQSPPRWDESGYLVQATVLHQTLVDEGLFASLQKVFNYDRGRVMLTTIIVQPFFSAFGASLKSAMITINLFWFLLSWAIYGMARITAGPTIGQRAGFFALALFSLYPLTTELSNYYLVEFPLVSFVCATNYSFLKFQYTSNRKWLWSAGFFIALGMLTKVAFPCFILSGFILFLFEFKKSKKLFRTLKLFSPVYLVPLMIAGPYYVYNFRPIVETTLFLSSSKLAKMYNFGPIFDWRTVFTHWKGLFLNPTMVTAVICSVTVITGLILKEKRLRTHVEGAFPLWLFFIWFMVPFMLDTFGAIKDSRYVYPALVPLFVLSGIGISWLINVPIGVAAAVIISALPVSLYLSANGLIPQSVMMKLDYRLQGSAPSPDPRDWKIENLVTAIGGALDERRLKKEIFFLGGNRYYHLNLLRFYGLKNHEVINYATLPYYSYPDMTLSQALDFIASTPHSAVLHKTGTHYPEFSSRLDKEILAVLEHNTDYEHHDLGIVQPDDSRFILLINRASLRDPLNDAEVSAILSLNRPLVKTVIFGEKFMLLGALRRQAGEGFFVDFYWKSLTTQPRSYVTFIHLLDAAGKIIRVLDRPQDENKALVKEGMIWCESVYVPAKKLTELHSIGLGLYIPPSAASALTVRNGSTDWNGRRLLILLPLS